MMQKRSLWAVLAAVLLMVLATNGAMADEDVFTSGDYQYCILEDGTAEITRYSGEDSVLKIPNTLDGKTVTSIGDGAFAECSSLTSIELPDSVTSIGDRAFLECWSLTSIELPDSVTSIGDAAFLVCSDLTSIELPDSVTSMGVNPFADCWRLKNIQVSPEQPVFAVIDGVLFNKAEKSLICYPAGKQEEAYEVPQGIQQIKSYAFYDCSALTSIKLPDSVTSIGESAFCGCDSLTTIELPDSVTSIGESAFLGCSALTNIELPDSVTSIGDEAFAECSSLTSIELPGSVTSIGDSAFKKCDNLTMTVQRDSYAARYAKDNNLKYTYPNDWLNN